MKKFFILSFLFISAITLTAQNVMTPEMLWQLGRVSPIGISKDGQSVIYRVTTPSVENNDFSSKVYRVPVSGGTAVEIENHSDILRDKNLSPDGKHQLYHKAVKLQKVLGKDYYE